MLCRRGLVRLLLAAWLALWLGGCNASQVGSLSLENRYQRAIADAAVASPAEVSHRLERVVPGNTHLRWRQQAGQSQVLTVTWTSWTGYDTLVGQSTVLAREVWVTCVPELRTFMAAQPPHTDRELRSAQLLGLAPQPGKTRFVELWAAPASLFRPAADPAITTDTAPVDAPGWQQAPDVTPAFVDWFTALKASSYGANGYPWTRLGYTFDWGNPQDDQGLSEFVIRAGSTVDVAAVTANSAYLN